MTKAIESPDIPEGWRTMRLGDIANIQFSSVDKKSIEGEEPVGLCNYTDVFYNRRIHSGIEFMVATARPLESRRWSLKYGDVLFTKDSETRTEIGVPAFVTEDMPNILCGYHLGRARPKPGTIDGSYLARSFLSTSVSRQLSRIANGVTRFGLTLVATKSMTLLVPPLHEQKAIAEVLDSIDDAIEYTDRLIAATERLHDSLLHELLTKGLPGWHTEWQEHPNLGTIPAEWRIVGLGQIASIRKQQVKPEAHNETPYVGLEHIRSGGSLLGYGRAGNTQSAKTVFKTGDTLFGKLRPNLRKVARPGFDGVCSTDILALFPSQRVNGRYLLGLMSSERIHRLAVRSCAGTRMPRTSWSFLRGVKIAVPDIREQAQVAEVLAGVDNAVERMDREKAALAAFKESISDALLTGRVRVPMRT
ncbi:MAG: restriction endonuclease subunit S [bacterium]|nr:restriction endonuclease subunit S [bacterium]